LRAEFEGLSTPGKGIAHGRIILNRFYMNGLKMFGVESVQSG
jgi:hypothetical protein